jgi:aldose sugar dehydrogenase
VRGLIPAAAGAAALLQLAITPACADVESVTTQAGPVRVAIVTEGLVFPWGMAVLPDGRLLVTEKPGRLRILNPDGTLSQPLAGTPEVVYQSQGGLLDVALDPDFSENSLVYLSFSEAGEGGSSTALGRGRLADDRIEDFHVIFRQEPKVSGDKHFGGRIVFSPDGYLFLTLGDRFQFDPAQDLSNHIGTVVRINRDGSIPSDNPFVDRAEAKDAIWSYGHRNIQAGAFHPQSGVLWIVEMGPKGGDELNQPEAGRNYGWPLVSWGSHYDDRSIPDPPTRPEFADAVKQWTPVISPSGMIFYTGDMFPEWRGSALIGSLSQRAVVRVTLDGANVVDEEIIGLGARIRDVQQAPDGAVYVLTDQRDGKVWRLTRAD